VAERVPQPIKSTDCYPLLLFHVSRNNTASWNLGRIKEDFKALGKQAKSIGAQDTFSSILPVGSKGSARNRHIMNINSWFHGWCNQECFNGTFFNDYNLLGMDVIHLSRKGKGIFGIRLVDLVWRALSRRTQWAGHKVTMLKPLHPVGEEGWPTRAVTKLLYLPPKLRSRRPKILRVGMATADPLEPLWGKVHARVRL